MEEEKRVSMEAFKKKTHDMERQMAILRQECEK